MSKSPDAFRTISEVADWLGVQAHVLRFWESRFNQVKPVKRAGGRRYYRPNDMRLLGGIKKLLHEDGITIKGVQRILREQGVNHVASLSQGLEESAEPIASAQDNVVVPFASKPAPANEQIKLDLGETTASQAAPKSSFAPSQAPGPTPKEPTKTAEPELANEAPRMVGIATRAWQRTDFDNQLLKQIAPVAKDLRAVLDRIENRTAG